MGIEIERKFLVVSDEWKKNAKGVEYIQGYMPVDKGPTVRVRLAGGEGFLTIKSPRFEDGISRSEFEYQIPKADAVEMLKTLCLPQKIEKTRYKIPYEGLVWEVDVFHGANQGLTIAEVEMPRADYPVIIPPWIGADVSDDKRYHNSQLAKLPYNSPLWDKNKAQKPYSR
jgi:adenylate cyclase